MNIIYNDKFFSRFILAISPIYNIINPNSALSHAHKILPHSYLKCAKFKQIL